jgi:hypothetical protein
MKLSTSLLSIGIFMAFTSAGSAFAASGCSSAPAAQWQPKSKLESQLTAQGMKVRQVKTEGGCYEVYATDKSGKRQNMAFNAQTLKQLDNAEAGEK